MNKNIEKARNFALFGVMKDSDEIADMSTKPNAIIAIILLVSIIVGFVIAW